MLKFPAAAMPALAAAAISWGSLLPAWAADPFRTSNPRPIGNETQMAFELMFKRGDYRAASKQIDKALKTEASEPLLQGMKAAMAYLDNDLPGMQVYANKTRAAAQQLLSTDRLRGHLYVGASYLLEAGYVVTSEGVVKGAPKAIGLVQKLLDEIEKAREVDTNDPELNLVKGYMDMLIAGVLPLADLENALSSLRVAAPEYLKWRGIALGYRDAKKPEEALEAVEKAIAAAPENPELYYLKGQILWMKGDPYLADAEKQYRKAVAQAKQLPPGVSEQLQRECATLTGKRC